MTGFRFLILFGLSCMLFPCEGQVKPPSNGTKLIFLPGSTVKIDWSYVGDISKVNLRVWYFKTSESSQLGELTVLFLDRDPKPKNTTLIPRFEIEKPATLVLKNVDKTYNGIFIFLLRNQYPLQSYLSEVVVIIAKKPTVTLSCSSPITVNEGDNVACVCRGKGGNPSANVTWYDKDGVQIGGTRKEEQTLTLSNVVKTVSGTYKCVAKSHTLKDEKSIEIIVYYAVPPTVISLTSTPENVVFGESVVITCEAIAVPLPSYTIIHNSTEVVSTHKTYIITDMKYSDAGSYKCIATSILGNSSKAFSLSVGETNTQPTKDCEAGKTALEEANRSGPVWYMVVVILVSGIIIGILLFYMVFCSRRKFRSRKPQSKPEPKTTEVDATYQELDLSKINTEDNYQSLRVNAANDEEATYTKLNKTRDVEDNYQSLT